MGQVLREVSNGLMGYWDELTALFDNSDLRAAVSDARAYRPSRP